MEKELQDKLVDDVLEILPWSSAISDVLSSLREKGWKNIGNISNLETLLTQAGFSLDRKYSKPNSCGHRTLRATYVTL